MLNRRHQPKLQVRLRELSLIKRPYNRLRYGRWEVTTETSEGDLQAYNIERFEQVTTEFIYSKAKSNLEMDTGDLTRNEWMISVIRAAWFSLRRHIRAVTRVSGACRLAGRGDERDAISWQRGGEMPVPVWRFWANILGVRLSYLCFIIAGAMSQGL